MKTINALTACGIALLTMNPAPDAKAADLYYNPANPGNGAWDAADYWSAAGTSGPFNAAWSDGSTAQFQIGAARTVDLFGETISAGGIVLAPTAANLQLQIRSLSVPGGALVFNGGSISMSNTGSSIRVRDNVTVSGDFTLSSGSLTLDAPATGVSAYAGTVTVSGGTFAFGLGRFDATSNITVNSGTVNNTVAGDHTLGALRVAGGVYYLGATSGGQVDTTVGSLAGTGGIIQVRGASSGSGGVIHSLTVNQQTNTAYSGNLLGDNTVGTGSNYFTFTKSGSGSLSFDGSSTVRLLQGTTIDGGALYIDGPASNALRTFDNIAGGAGSAAITVANGGALGGGSTITILNQKRLLVENGGALIPGGDGTAGRLNVGFDTGGALDISGVGSASQWFRFDLGSNAEAGVTYDSLRLVSSANPTTFRIGTGLLDFADFKFNLLSGFGEGSYTLVTLAGVATWDGSLGSNLSGAMGEGYFGILSQQDQNLVLDVSAVPEPKVVGLGLAAMAVVLLGGRLRLRSRQPSLR